MLALMINYIYMNMQHVIALVCSAHFSRSDISDIKDDVRQLFQTPRRELKMKHSRVFLMKFKVFDK